MLCRERSPSTPLNNQLPVPSRQNSIKSFRSLSSHNGYVPVDQRDVLPPPRGAGSGSSSGPRTSLAHSRQSSFRSVVGSLLFDGSHATAADYQHNDLSPPELPTDDSKDSYDLYDCHRDADTEASSSSSSSIVVAVAAATATAALFIIDER